MESIMENQQHPEVESNIEQDPIIKQYEEELKDFLSFPNKTQTAKNEEQDTMAPSTHLKRKRRSEDDVSLNILTDIFLRIVYPISKCMTKFIAIGLVKGLGYTPNAILSHGTKKLFFPEGAWESFNKHLHLIECYLEKNIIGKKTAIRLLECDVEIDIIKYRGEQQVRLRDLAKHDDKILLSRDEFYVLSCAISPVTRYMKQLIFSSSVIEDYLVDAMEKHPDAQILHGPIDTSIFNRIPFEVEMWRSIKEYELAKETKVEEADEQTEDKENV